MKAVHIIGGGDIGGAKTHVLSLIKELSRDIEVKLISMREGSFAEDAKQFGIDVDIIKGRNPVKSFSQLLSTVREHDYDVIHCHGAKGNVYGVLLKLFVKKPVVTTVHSDYRLDYMHNALKRLTFGFFNTLALRAVDYYIGVTDIFADMLIDRGFNPERIHTIYNGIDFSRNKDRTPEEKEKERQEYFGDIGLAYKPGDVVVGMAVRFHPVKDVPTLIKAFAKAARKEGRLKLVIGGGSESEQAEKERLEQLTASLGVSDRVCFAGWINDMDRFLGAIDINTLTSITESFPYSILEAVRAGCAIITSRVGGMPQLIDHGVNGYLFEPRDHHALAVYLLELAADAKKREELSTRLYEKASTLFSLSAMKNTQLHIYNDITRNYARRKAFRDGVFICGAYGRGNLGDDAIMEAVVSEMSGIDPDMPMTIITRTPRETSRHCRKNAIHTFNIPLFLLKLLRTRLYISGGGTLIQDISSTRSILYYLFSMLAAKLLGASVMLYGCGIGPVIRPFNRKMTCAVLNFAADIITLRDEKSQKELKSLGVKKPKIILTADPTLSLTPADDWRIKSAFLAEGIPYKGNYICFALRNWRGLDAMLGHIAAAAEYAYSIHGLTPVFFPMEKDTDAQISEKLAASLGCRCYVFRNRYSVSESIGIISAMRVVAGMRLHSLIFAAISGTPYFGISYDIKVESFIRYSGNRLFIKLESLDSAAICSLIDRAVTKDRAEITGALAPLMDQEKQNRLTAAELLGK